MYMLILKLLIENYVSFKVIEVDMSAHTVIKRHNVKKKNLVLFFIFFFFFIFTTRLIN